MDLRIQKTEQAIKNAFIRLRSGKPLEKITVKELCALAVINKSTFYDHYQDIYALSEAMEKETVASIIESIGHLKEYTPDKSDIYTRELCLAFMSQSSLIKILFSGREQSRLGCLLDSAIKEMLFRKYPGFQDDMSRQVLISYCIQGAYHAYLNNPDADTDTYVRTVEEIVRCLKPLLKTT
ncbi:MAG TPA: TetR/AcrR family transcriptional regulator [Candidatus Mediterraneibacter merdipullorum]|nr:TetR/AcrR family transcriptional regulator [Candidatus Mediterraneibacter merdipullorum]